MKYLILLMLFSGTAYAHDRHNEPTPINVPDDGSNHNALIAGVVILGAVCWYHQCWKPKPVKAESTITPEIPENEYMRLRQR